MMKLNEKISIFKILEIYGVEPETVKLVRHGNKEIPIRETFNTNISRLEAYQSFQHPNRFGNAKSIVVFAPSYKTTAIFLGLWDINGCTENSKLPKNAPSILKKHGLPVRWMKDAVLYDLKRNHSLDDLSERLVIEWEAATVSWVQSKDKEVVEIKGKHSIGEFQSFGLVDLDYRTLQKLVNSPGTNLTWVKALSSVRGIYLIQDKASGRLYVGSAYGDKGIYGRWSSYAKNGHGGNQELKSIDASNFQFSILEIVSATAAADDIIHLENRWKEKLGTRDFGLNRN
ncbi:MAG: GIY-YIG nuclease family protein [Bacteroidetes bacterium]|nr:GIY-YIG nuclease family protein [Bacteroidota bacterium]